MCFWIAGNGLFAGDHPAIQRCGTVGLSESFRPATGTGGIYLSAEGVLRVLVVFASFPDDEIYHPYWPAHQPPLFMERFVDPDTSTLSSDPFNLTHYFRQMSLGKFLVVGEAIWVETRHSQEEYRNSGSHGHANMDLLPDRVDSLVDFSLYDNWSRLGNYSHVNTPDGVVDMIIVVWRTTIFEFLGEASLGYKPALLLDGRRVEMGYPAYLPFPAGSGVTCVYPYGDDPQRVMRTMVHEVGHWLLGSFHPYNGLKPDGKFQFWGILCPSQRASSCANAYDREQLGWITPRLLESGSTVTLGDFVTTGDAGKYHPINGEPFEYFYLENHQHLSNLDDVTSNPLDRGLWVLHQQGPYSEMDNVRILPADGKWEWGVETASTSCFGTAVPVFSRGWPWISAGRSHRDQLVSPKSLLNWMLALRGPEGEITCGKFFAGEKFYGAFDTSRVRVFSPYSNPASSTWSAVPTPFAYEVVEELNGVLTLTIPLDPQLLAPARRFLGVSPAGGTTPAGTIALAWGSQWAQGQALEADVTGSELERSTGGTGNWVPVYSGPATSWSDSALPYDSAGTDVVRFRVRVRDNQGKYSTWSNAHSVRVSTSTAIRHDGPTSAPAYGTHATNFPNPFNPHTTIQFFISSEGWTSVEVFDLLGKRLRTLLNTSLPSGVHSIVWDGRDEQRHDVSAGVYVYRVTHMAGSVSRTMVLLR